MRPKVLILNKMLKPDTGGVEEVVEQHRQILGAEFEVTAWGAKSHLHKKKGTEVKVDAYGTTVHFRSQLQIQALPVSLSFIWNYFRTVSQFDLIELHLPFPIGSLLCLLKRPKKLIVVWHSDLVRPKFLKPIIGMIDKWVVRQSDLIVSTSKNLAVHSDTINKNPEKTTVIPIHATPLHDSKPLPELSNPPKPYILFFGRVSYYKGIHVLASAIERYKGKFNFIIAGPGHLSDDLRVKLNNPQTTVINRTLSEHEKSWLLKNCSALAFPSTLKSEAFGIVQLEAMQYAKPVINTSLPTGVPEVARDQIEGITCNPGDVSSLVAAIYAIENDELRERLGKNANQRVTVCYSENIVREKLLNSFKALK